MDVIKIYHTQKKIKLYLVFFCTLTYSSCNSNGTKTEVVYESEKAVAVVFSSYLTLNNAKVVLASNTDIPILGEFTNTDNGFRFQPVIPFAADARYLIINNKEQVSEFSIKPKIDTMPPTITVIYPSTATVPENLLKLYIQFSKPMQEVGKALDYITVVDETTEKEVNVFLELDNELWNKEHTLLTLWLDPGRIKTDLIPNKTLGLPIINGHRYILTIDKNWKDATGNTLAETYTKQFRVTSRDSKIPKIDAWELLSTPKVLTINFNEPMDGILALEVFSVKSKDGAHIPGKFELSNNETILKFYPEDLFKNGNYTLIVDSHFEDLAGNNLNHLFDRDITKTNTVKQTETRSINFSVE